jgi:ubiquinone/menaquinone biosynthesis C-methylase UbiE
MVLETATHEHLLAHHGDYHSFADLMEDTHARRFDSVFWGIVKAYCPEKHKVISDFGTGPGMLLPDLAERFPHSQIVGVEAQPEMLKRAEKRVQDNPSIELIAHDLSQPGVPGLGDSTVDLLIASMVLHEFQMPGAIISEMARVVRAGGRVIAYDWVRQPLESYCEGMRPETLDQITHFSEHCRYTPQDIAWLFESSGFKIVEWMTRRSGRFAIWVAERNAEGAEAA